MRRAIAALLFLLLPALSVAGEVTPDRWYVIEIAGRPCGYAHQSIERAGELVTSRRVERFRVARNGRSVEVGLSIVFVETERGRPVSAEVESFAGGTPTRFDYRFTSDGLECTTTQQGRSVTRAVELPDVDWLTPAQADAFISARIEAGARSVVHHAVRPADGMEVVRIDLERIGDERHVHRGRSVPVGRWRARTSGSPIEIEELRSTDGTLVLAESDLGIGVMRVVLSDRDTALASLEADAPELLVSTIVPVTGMPGDSERLRRVRYRITFEGIDDFSLPEAGGQRVTMQGDGVCEVEVAADRGSSATGTIEDHAACLASSALIDIEDPEVVRFTERALRGVSSDPRTRASALRRAVGRHVRTRNFGTAFASAGEVVRSREGDCTEHAVLLAAALRVDGLPARVATGLVHCRLDPAGEPGFAWHMWTQALIDGRWIDLDPTRPLDFDAGHLLVSTSALEAGGGEDDLARILPLLGRLEVRAIEIDGRPTGESTP